MIHIASSIVRASLALLSLACISSVAWAQPTQNPSNGHWYAVVRCSVRSEPACDWQTAKADAESQMFNGMSGYLATLTSPGENEFVRTSQSPPVRSWIGGMQDPAGSEPDGGWEWVTGETWKYANWNPPNEPNNSGGNEECAEWRTTAGAWNDVPCSIERDYYIIEFGTESPSRATFVVNKHFDDGNPAEVRVVIECTTGDPISQEATFSEDDNPIEFIVQDFDDGELDCDITEDPIVGYSTEYEAAGGADTGDGVDGCRYDEVEFGQSFFCDIYNDIDSVNVLVEKVWIDDQAVVNSEHLFAGGKWYCEPVANRISGRGSNGYSKGFLWFADPSQVGPGLFSDTDDFSFYPHYEGTTCSITELELDSDIFSDDSDCDDLEFFPGYELDLDDDDDPIPTCTIINTRVYAGIPTMSEYGLALLALLMLGVGFVAYRRFA